MAATLITSKRRSEPVTRQLSLLSRLSSVFDLPQAEIERVLHPDFVRYFRGFMTGKDFSSYIGEIEKAQAITHWSGRVLDCGCGFGVTTVCLKASGATAVVGLDFNPTKVATATRLARFVEEPEITFLRGTAEALSFRDQTFDGVLIKAALSHLPSNTNCLAESYRVLKSGGSLLIMDDRNWL